MEPEKRLLVVEVGTTPGLVEDKLTSSAGPVAQLVRAADS